MELSYIQSLCYGKNEATSIYLNRGNTSLIIFYQKINNEFQKYDCIFTSVEGILITTKDYVQYWLQCGIYFIDTDDS